MGLRVEHLETDVVCPRIQMVLHTCANRFHVTPCDERIHETVAALAYKVVVGEAEAAPVVGVVRQVEVPGDVPACDRSGLVRVCLQHHGLLRQKPAAGAENSASLDRVLRCDEIWVGALRSFSC